MCTLYLSSSSTLPEILGVFVLILFIITELVYTHCGKLENVMAKKKFNILFIFRQRGREGEREGEKHQCLIASHTPHIEEPGPQPRHVP